MEGEQNYKIIKGKNYFCVKTHNYAGVKWIKGTKYYASDNYTLMNKGCEYYCPEYSKEEHNNLFEEVKYDGCVENKMSANKVESKFKVGKWYLCTKDFFGKGVTFDKNTAYYCAKEGCLQNEYGCHIAIVKDLYDNFKLWTIQDAKDGDVLVCNINKAEIGGDIEKLPNITPTICVYQNVVKDKDYIHTYCSLYNGSSLVLSNSMYYNTFVYNIQPATKEQHDLLFSKMKEEGYVWDEVNKKLTKKIGDVERIQYDSLNCQKNIVLKWSEEDNKILVKIITALMDANNVDCVDFNVMYNWLISIKERMEKQQ